MRRSTTRSRWGALLLLLGTLAVSGSSCPFNPRDSHPPCTPGVDAGCRTPVPFVQPISPEVVRDNIVKALKKRPFVNGSGFDGPNLIPNYELSLDEAFVYVPDAIGEAAANDRSCNGNPFFLDWGKDREVRFMQIVLEEGTSRTAPPDTVDLAISQFQLSSGGSPDPDRPRYTLQYVLTLKYAARDTIPRRVECYAANAIWDFIGFLSNDNRLLRWEDTESLTDFGCAGGNTLGAVGVLKALDGQCP
jgi:hypothetical protein